MVEESTEVEGKEEPANVTRKEGSKARRLWRLLLYVNLPGLRGVQTAGQTVF